jgi:hypothetical protein
VGGVSANVKQPLGIALVAGRFREPRLLELGSAVEAALRARVDPSATPALADELIALGNATAPARRREKQRPVLTIDSAEAPAGKFTMSGHAGDASGIGILRVYVNGSSAKVTREGDRWHAELAANEGTEIRCVPHGIVVAFAEDQLGNAAAALRNLSPARECAHE